MTETMSGSSTDVIAWLTDEGRRIGDRTAFVEALAGRLNAAGAGITRMTTGVPLLHPLVYSSSYLWEIDKPAVERLFMEAPNSSAVYQASPIRVVYEGGGPVRRRLDGPEDAFDFPILKELKDQGLTDYVVLPLPFADGSTKAASFATDRAGGFDDAALALFDAIAPTLALVIEIQALRRTAETLLDTYLGRQTGRRVLDGQVRRGDGDDIHAVIWFCDLRGSTPLADALGRRAFLDLLNRFLECMAGAVLDHGGEVLRFIGDAGLAIFPIPEDSGDAGAAEACARAVTAARDAMARVVAVNEDQRTAGRPEIAYGIGLHLGDVMYGNIGAPERLEFTVIGAAANEAARIEGLTKDLGVSFVASEAVARRHEAAWESLGHHPLRGVAEALEIFTLRDA